MRKLKLQVQLSVDGYMAGPNGELDWTTWNWDDELKKFAWAINDPIDTILLGRKMADGFINHWSGVATNPNDPDHSFGVKMNDSKKVVFTKTLKESPWQHNTVLATGDLHEEVNNLKKQSDKDIIVYGGSDFVSNLIKANLIDDYYLFINPVTLGQGLQAFKSSGKLKLKEGKAFSCGVTVLHYELMSE